MGTRKLRRLLHRRSAAGSRAVKQAAQGNVPGRPSGTVLLRQFISTLGPRAEASLSRGWVNGGTAVNAANEWEYVFRQGRDAQDLATIRHHLNGRLLCSGGRLQAGAWTRLLCGSDYTVAPAKRQIHLLVFTLVYCPCLKCRIVAMRADLGLDDVDEMLADAEMGNEFVEMELPSHLNHVNVYPGYDPAVRIRRTATFVDLPSVEEFQLIGESLGKHEFELGLVSKINGRSCRVQFAPFAKQFFSDQKYCGDFSMNQVLHKVAEKAKHHYRKHKGKTERRFYVHGTLVKFLLDGCGLALHTSQNNTQTQVSPIGTLYRKQVMSVFIGELALEDSFGSFLQMDAPFYLGFGQDKEGAQTVYSDGSMGEPRYLGINELRTHLDITSGDDIRIMMR